MFTNCTYIVDRVFTPVFHRFQRSWQFPNCCGALDGKHVIITAPENSISEFFNYKKNFSVNLMALVYSRYRFIYIDVEQKGSVSDGGVFDHSAFGTEFLSGECLYLHY